MFPDAVSFTVRMMERTWFAGRFLRGTAIGLLLGAFALVLLNGCSSPKSTKTVQPIAQSIVEPSAETSAETSAEPIAEPIASNSARTPEAGTQSTPDPAGAVELVGTFTEQVDGKDVSVSLVSDGKKAMAYVCDGEGLSIWMSGNVTNDTVLLTHKSGASLRAKITTTSGVATVEPQDGLDPTDSHVRHLIEPAQVKLADGRTFATTLATARDNAGLYRYVAGSGSSRVLAGWIVGNDGVQRGVEQTGTQQQPAAPLNVEGQTASAGGITVAAPSVDPQTVGASVTAIQAAATAPATAPAPVSEPASVAAVTEAVSTTPTGTAAAASASDSAPSTPLAASETPTTPLTASDTPSTSSDAPSTSAGGTTSSTNSTTSTVRRSTTTVLDPNPPANTGCSGMIAALLGNVVGDSPGPVRLGSIGVVELGVLTFQGNCDENTDVAFTGGTIDLFKGTLTGEQIGGSVSRNRLCLRSGQLTLKIDTVVLPPAQLNAADALCLALPLDPANLANATRSPEQMQPLDANQIQCGDVLFGPISGKLIWENVLPVFELPGMIQSLGSTELKFSCSSATITAKSVLQPIGGPAPPVTRATPVPGEVKLVGSASDNGDFRFSAEVDGLGVFGGSFDLSGTVSKTGDNPLQYRIRGEVARLDLASIGAEGITLRQAALTLEKEKFTFIGIAEVKAGEVDTDDQAQTVPSERVLKFVLQGDVTNPDVWTLQASAGLSVPGPAAPPPAGPGETTTRPTNTTPTPVPAWVPFPGLSIDQAKVTGQLARNNNDPVFDVKVEASGAWNLAAGVTATQGFVRISNQRRSCDIAAGREPTISAEATVLVDPPDSEAFSTVVSGCVGLRRGGISLISTTDFNDWTPIDGVDVQVTKAKLTLEAFPGESLAVTARGDVVALGVPLNGIVKYTAPDRLLFDGGGDLSELIPGLTEGRAIVSSATEPAYFTEDGVGPIALPALSLTAVSAIDVPKESVDGLRAAGIPIGEPTSATSADATGSSTVGSSTTGSSTTVSSTTTGLTTTTTPGAATTGDAQGSATSGSATSASASAGGVRLIAVAQLSGANAKIEAKLSLGQGVKVFSSKPTGPKQTDPDYETFVSLTEVFFSVDATGTVKVGGRGTVHLAPTEEGALPSTLSITAAIGFSSPIPGVTVKLDMSLSIEGQWNDAIGISGLVFDGVGFVVGIELNIQSGVPTGGTLAAAATVVRFPPDLARLLGVQPQGANPEVSRFGFQVSTSAPPIFVFQLGEVNQRVFLKPLGSLIGAQRANDLQIDGAELTFAPLGGALPDRPNEPIPAGISMRFAGVVMGVTADIGTRLQIIPPIFEAHADIGELTVNGVRLDRTVLDLRAETGGLHAEVRGGFTLPPPNGSPAGTAGPRACLVFVTDVGVVGPLTPRPNAPAETCVPFAGPAPAPVSALGPSLSIRAAGQLANWDLAPGTRLNQLAFAGNGTIGLLSGPPNLALKLAADVDVMGTNVRGTGDLNFAAGELRSFGFSASTSPITVGATRISGLGCDSRVGGDTDGPCVEFAWAKTPASASLELSGQITQDGIVTTIDGRIDPQLLDIRTASIAVPTVGNVVASGKLFHGSNLAGLRARDLSNTERQVVRGDWRLDAAAALQPSLTGFATQFSVTAGRIGSVAWVGGSGSVRVDQSDVNVSGRFAFGPDGALNASAPIVPATGVLAARPASDAAVLVQANRASPQVVAVDISPNFGASASRVPRVSVPTGVVLNRSGSGVTRIATPDLPAVAAGRTISRADAAPPVVRPGFEVAVAQPVAVGTAGATANDLVSATPIGFSGQSNRVTLVALAATTRPATTRPATTRSSTTRLGVTSPTTTNPKPALPVTTAKGVTTRPVSTSPTQLPATTLPKGVSATPTTTTIPKGLVPASTLPKRGLPGQRVIVARPTSRPGAISLAVPGVESRSLSRAQLVNEFAAVQAVRSAVADGLTTASGGPDKFQFVITGTGNLVLNGHSVANASVVLTEVGMNVNGRLRVPDARGFANPPIVDVAISGDLSRASGSLIYSLAGSGSIRDPFTQFGSGNVGGSSSLTGNFLLTNTQLRAEAIIRSPWINASLNGQIASTGTFCVAGATQIATVGSMDVSWCNTPGASSQGLRGSIVTSGFSFAGRLTPAAFELSAAANESVLVERGAWKGVFTINAQGTLSSATGITFGGTASAAVLYQDADDEEPWQLFSVAVAIDPDTGSSCVVALANFAGEPVVYLCASLP
jgi:hypothetical protein